MIIANMTNIMLGSLIWDLMVHIKTADIDVVANGLKDLGLHNYRFLEVKYEQMPPESSWMLFGPHGYLETADAKWYLNEKEICWSEVAGMFLHELQRIGILQNQL